MSIYADEEDRSIHYLNRYLHAANLNFTPAMYSLGDHSHKEIEREKWYVLAATKGSLHAMYKLAELLLENDAVNLGVEWLEKASLQGCFIAADKFARTCLEGTITIGKYSKKSVSIPNNFEMAYKLFKKTDPIAAICLPFNAFKFLKEEPEERIKWLRVGASQGHAGCMWELAKLYDKSNRIYDAYVMYHKLSEQELGKHYGLDVELVIKQNSYVRHAQRHIERYEDRFRKAKLEYENQQGK